MGKVGSYPGGTTPTGSETVTAVQGTATRRFTFDEILSSPSGLPWINVKAPPFGAVGDGATDDTAALVAAIDYIKEQTNTAGFYGGTIEFPVGLYNFTESLVIAAADLGVVTTIRFKGQGGYSGQGGTRLQFVPASAAKGISILSGQQIIFEDMEIVSSNNNVITLIEIASQVSPTFSSFHTSFIRCNIRPFSGTSPTAQLIHILNSGLTTFDWCWIGGTDQKIRLGDTATGAGSFAGSNTAGQTRFQMCQLYVNVEMVNVLGLVFEQTTFARSNATTPVKIYPAASGFVRNDNVIIINCIQLSPTTSVSVDFFTQGSGSFLGDLVALNNRLDGYHITFVLVDGSALIEGNKFGPPVSGVGGVKAISLGSAVSPYARFSNNDFTALVAAGFTSYITDNRLTGNQPQIVGCDVSVDDDQVGVFMTVSRQALLLVSEATAGSVSLFAVDAIGTNDIATIFLGVTTLNGGLGTPTAGSGTDGNTSWYIGTDGILRCSNRLGATFTYRATLIPLGKAFP